MATEIDEIDLVAVVSNSLAHHARNAIITKETCTSLPHPQPCEPREHAALTLTATLRGLRPVVLLPTAQGKEVGGSPRKREMQVTFTYS